MYRVAHAIPTSPPSSQSKAGCECHTHTPFPTVKKPRWAFGFRCPDTSNVGGALARPDGIWYLKPGSDPVSGPPPLGGGILGSLGG